MEANGFSLILTIVNKGYADEVMDAAREAGARGGTILHGRGTGTAETVRVFGMSIDPEKEIVLILTKNTIRAAIMKSITQAAGLGTKGNGISIALPACNVIGGALNSDEE